MATSNKAVNYTTEQTADAIAQYATGASIDAIATALGKSTRSIIAKLSREGVYKAKEYKTKTGGATKTAKPSKASGVKKSVAPKYRHPASGATWTGRGKAPLWVVEAEKNGQMRQQFLI